MNSIDETWVQLGQMAREARKNALELTLKQVADAMSTSVMVPSTSTQKQIRQSVASLSRFETQPTNVPPKDRHLSLEKLRALFHVIERGLVRLGQRDAFIVRCRRLGYVVAEERTDDGQVSESTANSASPDFHQPASAEGGSRTIWEERVRRADLLMLRMNPELARHAYHQAAEQAPDPAFQALALTQEAHSLKNIGESQRAWIQTDRVLQLLNLQHLVPEEGPPLPTLLAATRTREQLLAYANVARIRGRLLLDKGGEESWSKARRAFQILEDLARALDYKTWIADALQLQGRRLIAEATGVRATAMLKHNVLDWQKIERAVELCVQARSTRDESDWLGLGFDWQHEEVGHRLLDRRVEAKNAAMMMSQYFAREPARVHVRLLQGQLALLSGSDEGFRKAYLHFRESVDIGWEIRSPDLLFRALVGLAKWYEDPRQSQEEIARDCLAAAILAWWQPYRGREIHAVTKKYVDLFEAPAYAKKAIFRELLGVRGNRFPYYLLPRLGITTNEDHCERAKQYVDRVAETMINR